MTIYFINILLFIFFIYILFFEKHKKDNKGEYFLNFIIVLSISIILFAMAMPSSFHGHNSTSPLKKCYSAQRTLQNAIAHYNSDNISNPFPINCNDIDLDKYQKELLIKNKYLKEPVYPPNCCTFLIRDNDLFCVVHGSYDSDSPHFTHGEMVPGYEKYSKETETVTFLNNKYNQKDIEQKMNIIVGLIGLIAAFKFFIFTFI